MTRQELIDDTIADIRTCLLSAREANLHSAIIGGCLVVAKGLMSGTLSGDQAFTLATLTIELLVDEREKRKPEGAA